METKEKVVGKPQWIPGDIIEAIQVEAQRLTRERKVEIAEATVLAYWARRGQKAEPNIKGLLT